MITFEDIFIARADQEFIDNLAKKLDIDYKQVDIIDLFNIDQSWFANWVIYTIYKLYLNKIWLNEDEIDNLMMKINEWINCLATRISFDLDEYREQLMKLED